MQRIVFMGSPPAAVPALRAVAAAAPAANAGLVGVFTQPARGQGRQRRVQASAVAQAAGELALPVFTPANMKEEQGWRDLQALRPDLIVICAYGHLLLRRVLELPARGCFNLHFSLLPRWRGASPVQAALLAGDSETGVSVQRVVEALDAGPLAGCSPPLPILSQDTAGSLTARLAQEGARLLAGLLPPLLDGSVPLTPQDEARVTLCRKLDKAAGAIDCRQETEQSLMRKLRAFDPWPGCYGYLGRLRLGLLLAEAASDAADAPPGRSPEPGRIGAGGIVALAQGQVRLLQVKPEGKAGMSWQAFANGHPVAAGALLKPAPED